MIELKQQIDEHEMSNHVASARFGCEPSDIRSLKVGAINDLALEKLSAMKSNYSRQTR